MKISVILTAYGRRKYIYDALNSIFAQSLEHSKFEVVVVSNFDYAIENKPTDLQITNIVSEGTIGEFLAKGLCVARNEIVAFLDDDDLWERNRLEEVLRVFESDERIVYYHNSVRYIDDTGNELEILFRNPKRLNNHIIKVIQLSRMEVLNLINLGVSFNLSSIAVKKSVLNIWMDDISSIKANPDGFMFWSSLITGGVVCQDNRPLTRYRVHSENKTDVLSYEKAGGEIKDQIETFEKLHEHCSNGGLYKRKGIICHFIVLQILEWNSLRLMISHSGRKALLGDLKKMIGFWKYAGDITMMRIFIYSVAFLVTPRLFATVFRLISLRGNYRTHP